MSLGSRLEVLVRQLQGKVEARVMEGDGSPEGAVTAGWATLYLRRDAPDSDNAVYFKGSGSGDTGWRRFTSTGHAAA